MLEFWNCASMGKPIGILFVNKETRLFKYNTLLIPKQEMRFVFIIEYILKIMRVYVKWNSVNGQCNLMGKLNNH